MTHDHDPFGVEKKLSDPDGNVYRRPMRRNTRGQNSAAGAGVGAALYGTVGAAAGGAVGRSRAKAGVRALHSVGAAPSRARTAGIVAGHSLRTAGRAGAALGAAGAVYGAAVGAISPHRKDRKKLPLGRVQKSDGDPFGIDKSAARMGEQAAEWAGHLPKHTAGAVAANKSAFHASIEMPGHLRPVRPGLRIKKPQLVPNVAKSAFGVEHEVSKAHDDRQKQTAAMAGGAVASHAAASELRGRADANRTVARGAADLPSSWREHYQHKIRATRQLRGSRAATVATAGLTAGAVLNSQRRKSGVGKSAFGVDHREVVEKKKIGHILPGGKVPPAAARDVKVFKVRRAGDAPGRGAQGQRRGVRQGRV